MATIKNISTGPRGAWIGGVLVMVEAGATADGDFTDVNPEWFEGGNSWVEPSAPDPELIKAAVDGLDPANDDHWTSAGLPAVDAVKEALGADVTRAQIEAAAPEAKRPEA